MKFQELELEEVREVNGGVITGIGIGLGAIEAVKLGYEFGNWLGDRIWG